MQLYEPEYTVEEEGNEPEYTVEEGEYEPEHTVESMARESKLEARLSDESQLSANMVKLAGDLCASYTSW